METWKLSELELIVLYLHSAGLMMAKKVLHFGPSSQSYELSKIGLPLFGTKVPYFYANLRVGSQFCLLHGQKRSTFLPLNLDHACLMMVKNTF